MSQLRGTLWRRDNETWTLQGEKEWNRQKNKFYRPSLGTFATEEEGIATQPVYTVQKERAEFVLDEVALKRVLIANYLGD